MGEDYTPGWQVATRWNGEPLPEPDLQKHYKAERKAGKRKAERQFALTRAQVRAIVMDRANGCCERCGRKVDFDCAPYLDHHAEVNEPDMRALGADPLDPAQCELCCHACHFGGPSRAHAPTKERMKQR
jgi:hypothetical protein